MENYQIYQSAALRNYAFKYSINSSYTYQKPSQEKYSSTIKSEDSEVLKI